MEKLLFVFLIVTSGFVVFQVVESKTYQTYNGYGKGLPDYSNERYSKGRIGYPPSSMLRAPISTRPRSSPFYLKSKLRSSTKRAYDIEPLVFDNLEGSSRYGKSSSPRHKSFMHNIFKHGKDTSFFLPRMQAPTSIVKSTDGRTVVPSLGRSDTERSKKSHYMSQHFSKPRRPSDRSFPSKSFYDSRKSAFPSSLSKIRHTPRLEGKLQRLLPNPRSGKPKEYFRFNRYSDTIEGKSISNYLNALEEEADKAFRSIRNFKLRGEQKPEAKYYIDQAGRKWQKLYDPCRKMPDNHYVLDERFRKLFSTADPECNFVKCANRKAYINPCSTATRNEKDGTGFCSRIDLEGRCGISYHDVIRPPK